MEAQEKMPIEDKKEIREKFLKLRHEISPVVEQHYAAEIASKVLNNFDFEGKVVAGYWPIRGEVDIRPVLMHLDNIGQTCALPLVVEDNEPLIFRKWTNKVAMAKGKYDIPVPDKNDPVAEIVTPDVILVPFVAYDRRGNRIGYGGGYYDRTVKALREAGTVEVIGVGFNAQKSSAILPMDEHDIAMECVVTERMIDRF